MGISDSDGNSSHTETKFDVTNTCTDKISGFIHHEAGKLNKHVETVSTQDERVGYIEEFIEEEVAKEKDRVAQKKHNQEIINKLKKNTNTKHSNSYTDNKKGGFLRNTKAMTRQYTKKG